MAALVETIIRPIPTLASISYCRIFSLSGRHVIILSYTMIILGALGATIGTTAIYLIALKLGRRILLRYLKFLKISEKKLERVETWFEKYGDKAVFLGRMIPSNERNDLSSCRITRNEVSKVYLVYICRFTSLVDCYHSCRILFWGKPRSEYLEFNLT